MNQGVYEEDNYHVDADYKANAARKSKGETRSLQKQQEKPKRIDRPSEEGGKPAAKRQGSKPQQTSTQCDRDIAFAAAKNNDVEVLRRYAGSLNDLGFRDPKTGETVLHRALSSGSYQVVELLLNSEQRNDLASAIYDENVHRQSSCKTTLHLATQSGKIEVVRNLLAALKDPETKKSLLSKRFAYLRDGGRPRSVTCLHIAAMNGFDDIVKHFVTVCRVNVNETNELNDTALMFATLEGRRSTVELLIGLKAHANTANDQGSTALYYAVRKQDADLVKLLVQQPDVDVNARRDHGLECPLVLAAAMGSSDIVRLLLSHGADVNATVNGSETALHYAASEGHLELCRMLLEYGANIEATNSKGESPLLEAAGRGQVEVVDYLLSQRADAFKMTVSGNSTVLHAAVRASNANDRISVVRHFMKYIQLGGYLSLLDATDEHGYTALHWAVKIGCKKLLPELRSLKLSAKDRHGNTPMHLAAALSNSEMFEELLRLYPRDVRTTLQLENESKMTPLRLAICHGSQRVIERAITAGADLAFVGQDGKTVLHWIADEITVNNSRVEMLMQTVQTITDASVSWFLMKKNEKIEDHSSDYYLQQKSLALRELFGRSFDKEGLTVFQYATTIGCIPLVEFISKLAATYMKNSGVSSDTGTMPGHSPSKSKVYPEETASVPEKEVTRQVVSVLEMVVSNENEMTAAAMLEINPLQHMAERYWRWYQWLWTALTLFHCCSLALLTAYGVDHASSSNDTKVLEANVSLDNCSDFSMSPVLACTIVTYAGTVLVFLTSSSIGIFLYDHPATMRHSKKFRKNFEMQDFKKQRSSQLSNGILYQYGDLIGQIVWNLCGLIFGLAASIVVWSYLLCIPYHDYFLSLALLFGWIYTIYYLTRLRYLHQFSRMLKLIFGDFLTFFLVYLLILLAFGAAQHVTLLHMNQPSHQSLGQTMFTTFQWLIGTSSFWNMDPSSSDTETNRSTFLILLYVAYVCICTIVLMNMLIAAMSESFTEIRKNSNDYWRVDSLRLALNFQKTRVFFCCCRLFCFVIRPKCPHRSMPSQLSDKERKFRDKERELQWFLKFVNAGHQVTPKGKDDSNPS